MLEVFGRATAIETTVSNVDDKGVFNRTDHAGFSADHAEGLWRGGALATDNEFCPITTNRAMAICWRGLKQMLNPSWASEMSLSASASHTLPVSSILDDYSAIVGASVSASKMKNSGYAASRREGRR